MHFGLDGYTLTRVWMYEVQESAYNNIVLYELLCHRTEVQNRSRSSRTMVVKNKNNKITRRKKMMRYMFFRLYKKNTLPRALHVDRFRWRHLIFFFCSDKQASPSVARSYAIISDRSKVDSKISRRLTAFTPFVLREEISSVLLTISKAWIYTVYL